MGLDHLGMAEWGWTEHWVHTVQDPYLLQAALIFLEPVATWKHTLLIAKSRRAMAPGLYISSSFSLITTVNISVMKESSKSKPNINLVEKYIPPMHVKDGSSKYLLINHQINPI